MEQPVKGQVAIVTGAGQGIGRAIALRLSQDGMNLVLADLQGDAVAHVAEEIRAGGHRRWGHSQHFVLKEDALDTRPIASPRYRCSRHRRQSWHRLRYADGLRGSGER